MNFVDAMWRPPVELELWLILFYVVGVLAGARVVEAIAKAHFSRARAMGQPGFQFIESHDHYYCVGGATLKLHQIHETERLAIYRAPAFHCSLCEHKQKCTPNAESRDVHRSLATWAETDVGRFHQAVSILLFSVGGVLSIVGIWQWRGQPGSGYLMLALGGSLACLLLHGRRLRYKLDVPAAAP